MKNKSLLPYHEDLQRKVEKDCLRYLRECLLFFSRLIQQKICLLCVYCLQNAQSSESQGVNSNDYKSSICSRSYHMLNC